MKYYSIIADYKPDNTHRIPYKIKVKDIVTIKQIKSWWKITYPWLKIIDITEINEAEYKKGHNQFR